eukprot:3882236-Rhodomonas_salina.1
MGVGEYCAPVGERRRGALAARATSTELEGEPWESRQRMLYVGHGQRRPIADSTGYCLGRREMTACSVPVLEIAQGGRREIAECSIAILEIA